MLRTYNCPNCEVIEDYRNDLDILTHCPKCNAPIKQQYGGRFKLIGPGFYSTDNPKGLS